MTRTKLIALAATTSLLVASCGLVDREAALTEAIDGAVASDVDNASVTEAQCLTTTLMTDLGVEGFDLAGISAEDLTADPTILRSGATATEFDDALVSCLDLDARFSEAIQLAQLDSVDTACVDDDAISNEPLALALVDGIPITGPETAATVSAALADAIRGCADDTDLATVIGLDSPEALAAVLNADPFTTDEDPDTQDPCVVEAVVATIGIERLAELDITVDNTDFLAVTNDLTDDEFDAIVDGVNGCGLPANLASYISETETQMGQCAADRLSVDEAERLTNDRFRGRSLSNQASARTAVDNCAEEAIDALFGPELPVSAQFELFTRMIVNEFGSISGSNRYEDLCVARAFNTMVSEELLQAVFDLDTVLASGTPLTAAQDADLVDFSSISGEVGALCVEPWKRIRQDLEAADLGEELIECTIETAGEGPARMIVDGLPGMIRGELAGSFDVLDGMDLIGEAIGECGTPVDVAKWEDFLDFAFGPVDGGGDTDNRQSKPIEA